MTPQLRQNRPPLLSAFTIRAEARLLRRSQNTLPQTATNFILPEQKQNRA